MMKNEEHEKLLKNYREMLRHPKTDYRKICIDISDLSKVLRINAIQRNIELILAEYNPNRISKRNTPPAAKVITEIIECLKNLNDLQGKLENDHIYDLRQRKKNIDKSKEYLNKLNEHLVTFESSLKYLFVTAEAVLSSIILNYKEIISFNNMLDIAFDNRILHYDQLNVLKAFNHIRNLFAHNISMFTFVGSINESVFTMYKAIILETRDVICDLIEYYRDRIFCLTATTVIYTHKKHPMTDEIMVEYEKSLLKTIEQEKKEGIKKSILDLEGLPNGTNVKIKDLKQSK